MVWRIIHGRYTKMLAAQLVKHNINVNAIAPGATKSGRFVGTVKDGTQNPALADEKVRMSNTGTGCSTMHTYNVIDPGGSWEPTEKEILYGLRARFVTINNAHNITYY